MNFFKQKSYKLSFEYYCVGVSIEINCLGVTEVFVIQEQGKLKKLGWKISKVCNGCWSGTLIWTFSIKKGEYSWVFECQMLVSNLINLIDVAEIKKKNSDNEFQVVQESLRKVLTAIGHNWVSI